MGMAQNPNMPPYLGTSTWAARGTPADNSRKFISDVVPGGADMRYDANRGLWVPASGGSLTFCPGIVQMFLQSSGTMGANGALSALATTLPITAGPCYLYFPAGKAYSGSLAGFYYAVLSSGTAATVYNNRYTGGIPSIPASPTPIVDAGPGAYTQTTGAAVTAFTAPILGGLMSPFGQVIENIEFAHNLSAGAKVITRSLGGSTLVSSSRTSSGGHDSYTNRVRCNGPSRQNFYSQSESTVTGSAGQTPLAVDLSVDANFAVTLQLATATDYIGLQSLHIALVI